MQAWQLRCTIFWLPKIKRPRRVDWLKEAVDAYNWAKKNTKSGDENKKFDFLFLKDVRAYAAVALYRATGETKFHDQFITDATGSLTGSSIDGGRKDLVAAAFIYVTMPKNRPTNSPLLNNTKTSILAAADSEVVQPAEKRACRWGGNLSFPMLVGQPTTPMVQVGIMAHALTKSANYLTALQTTADYFLGNNPLSMTWITGVGERHPVQPFHMDWFYSTNPNNVIKGIVPYGPWRVEAFQDQNRGPWFDSWAYKTVFPTDIKTWPGHERWFDQRYGLFASEFTVHQNTVVAATVYGFLTNDKEKKTVVELPSITPTDDFTSASDTQFTVFPNPASSIVSLNVLDKSLIINQIRLLDMSGKYIQTFNFKDTASTIEINVKDYPPALYHLEITFDNGTTVVKKVSISR
ncbi:MAG: T9SS type A sorting domain-containing protein [Saprospiraceae bacterium]|nr:T9SS type A sorting domain-containing protein [Saprospiraceae bacterium]